MTSVLQRAVPCCASLPSCQQAQANVEHGRQEQAEQGHADHAGEDGDAGRGAHFGTGAVRENKRDGAGDERNRGHHDRAQAQAAGFERGLDDTLALKLQFTREFDD